MRRLGIDSIERKLTVLILVTVLVATWLAAAASAWRETEREFASTRDMLMGLAGTLSTSIATALAQGDKRQVATGLNSISSFPNVHYAVVVDQEGRRVHEVGTGIVLGSISDRLSANSKIGVLSSIRLGTYLVTAPVVSGGQRVGQISLIADISSLRTALWASARDATLTGFGAALLAILASLRLRRSITVPIASLTAATETIRASGDYSQSVAKTSTDETGRLVDAFNAMLTEIGNRDDALRRQRDNLADQVIERTRELVDAKDVAEQANAAKSDFLATVSHEIRTPMNGMLVMAELLSQSALDPKAKRHCEIIVKSGEMLLALINDILDLSKIEAGQMELERVAVSPGDVVDDVAQLFAERARANGLQFAYYVAPGVPEGIVADPLRLRQILTNLANNALKFTSTGGVLIRLEPVPSDDQGLRLKFSVCDTGIGIAPEKLERLFDPFTQAESSTTRRYGGTGIGLTICRRLATAMGGAIAVTSSVGEGSVFSLEIPVEVLEPAVAAAEAPAGRRSVALLLGDGPVRDALRFLCRDIGLSEEPRPAMADLVIADMATLSDARVLEELAGRRVLGVATDGIGEGRLPEFVAGVLDQPVGGKSTRSAIIDALTDVSQTPLRATQVQTVATLRSFAGRRVLAADDSPINREVLTETLHRLGVEVICVENGAEALAAVQTAPFDLIFMDGSMPVMSGIEATREIRAWERATNAKVTPIVALTAQVLRPQTDEWRDAGMSDFVSKPFTLDMIGACLERWLSPSGAALPVPSMAASVEPDLTVASDIVLDENVLRSIREIQSPGLDLFGRVVGLYREHAPRHVQTLLSLRNAELAAVAPAAHALKSLSRNIGARRVANLCEIIEHRALDGVRPPDAAWDLVASAVEATVAELASYQKQAA